MLQSSQNVPELWLLNCLKRCIFFNFALTSEKKQSLVKHFTYMHLKFLIMLFQKMV